MSFNSNNTSISISTYHKVISESGFKETKRSELLQNASSWYSTWGNSASPIWYIVSQVLVNLLVQPSNGRPSRPACSGVANSHIYCTWDGTGHAYVHSDPGEHPSTVHCVHGQYRPMSTLTLQYCPCNSHYRYWIYYGKSLSSEQWGEHGKCLTSVLGDPSSSVQGIVGVIVCRCSDFKLLVMAQAMNTTNVLISQM